MCIYSREDGNPWSLDLTCQSFMFWIRSSWGWKAQRFGSFKACSFLHLVSVLNLRHFGECEVTFHWVGFKSLLSWDVSDEIHILIAKWWVSFSVFIQNPPSWCLIYVLVKNFVLNICSVNIGRWATCHTQFNGILWAVVIHRFSHTIGTDVVN